MGPGASDCSRGCRPEPGAGGRGGGPGLGAGPRGPPHRRDPREPTGLGGRGLRVARAGLLALAGITLLVFATPYEALVLAWGPGRGGNAGCRPRPPEIPAASPRCQGSEAHASLKCCPEAGAVSLPVAPRSAALGGIGGRSRSRAELMPPGAKASASPPSVCPVLAPPRASSPRRGGDPGVPSVGGLSHWGCAWGASLQGEDPQEWPGATPLWEAPGPGGPSELTDKPPGGGPRHEQDAGGRGGGFRD